MTVKMIDAPAIRGGNTTLARVGTDGAVYSSNPNNPLVIPLDFVPATQTISAITVYLKGTTGGGTVSIALDQHNMSANTIVSAGAADTQVVTADVAKAVTVPGSYTPAAHVVARLSITGTNPKARVAGVEVTYA